MLKETALEMAQKIAGGPSTAIRLTKEGIYQGANVDLGTALKWEHFAYNVCRQTEDHEEAVRAFLEKRQPVFKGK
jgi:2-(1,2-epoxy-1,2-dihydrophenyl)acetyl-CoA isomerase